MLAGDCLCISTCTQACLDDVCLPEQNTLQHFAGAGELGCEICHDAACSPRDVQEFAANMT